MNSVDGSEGTSAAEEGIATRLRPRPPRPISLATTSGGTGRAPVWRDTVIGPFNPRASSYPHDVKARLVRAMCEQPHGLCVLRNVIDGSFLNRIQKRTTFDQCIEAYGKGLFGLDPYNITERTGRAQAVLSWWNIEPGGHTRNRYVEFESREWADDVVEHVRKALVNLDLIHPWHHICDGVALLRSLPGCEKQHQHADFTAPGGDRLFNLVRPFDGCTPFPVSVLIATSKEGARLWTPEGTIRVPQYGCVVFRGDLIHAGCKYNKENWRIHIYFGYKRSTDNNTLERRVPTRVDTHGRRSTVINTVGVEENNSFFDVHGRAKYDTAYPWMHTN